jgi:hypothetical protein
MTSTLMRGCIDRQTRTTLNRAANPNDLESAG